jgi:hypothetical protein
VHSDHFLTYSKKHKSSLSIAPPQGAFRIVRNFTTINPLVIEAGFNDVFVVAETLAAQGTV